MLRHGDGAREVGVGLRHEPETHLGHHTEVRLGEQTVDQRAHTELVLLPRLRVRQRAHARAQKVAVRQHDLHAAMRIEVIAERRLRIAPAVIERVTDETAPAGIRAIHPNLELVLLDVAIEVEVTHAGLDERRRVALADVENSIHAFQVEHDAARKVRRRAAVAQVLARGDRINRHPIGVRRTHDGLHLLDRSGRNRSRRHALFGLTPERRIRVAIKRHVRIAREHPVFADSGCEFSESLIERLLAHARWRCHDAPPIFFVSRDSSAARSDSRIASQECAEPPLQPRSKPAARLGYL